MVVDSDLHLSQPVVFPVVFFAVVFIVFIVLITVFIPFAVAVVMLFTAPLLVILTVVAVIPVRRVDAFYVEPWEGP